MASESPALFDQPGRTESASQRFLAGKYVLDESALQGLYSHGEASGSERRPPHVLPPNIIEQGINPFPKFMSASTVPVASKLLEVLKTVAETDEVEKNLDLPLYDSQVLDSMKTVELIVAITQEFGVDISPAEFEREKWATPRLIIADIESRLAV